MTIPRDAVLLPGVAPIATERRAPRIVHLAVATITAAAVIVPIVLLHMTSVRSFLGWHGLLHAGIAERVEWPFAPPENPFLAGRGLPYYWAWHVLAAVGARAAGCGPLAAMEVMTLGALALLVGAAVRLGTRCFDSLVAGVVLAALALTGAGAAAPLMLATAALRGPVLADKTGDARDDEEGLRAAAHPALRAALPFGDFRHGAALVWFIDNGSRGAALALLVPLALFWVRRDRLLLLGATSAAATALNPLIGLGAAGALGAAGLALPDARRRALGVFAGALAAAPVWWHLARYGGGGLTISHPSALLAKGCALAAALAALVPLAWLGARRAASRHDLRPFLGAGLLLAAATVLLHLPVGNEHNLGNAAQVLLAVPAAALFRRGVRPPRLAWVAVLCGLAGGAVTLAAFAGRPAAPIARAHGQLVRLPVDAPLSRFYDWVRRVTPRDTVLVVDPHRSPRAAGNVSELPAFTGRSLLVDEPLRDAYLVAGDPAVAPRAALATAWLRGERAPEDLAAARLPPGRPLLLVTWQAEDADLLGRLVAQHGAPRFRDGPIAAFTPRR